MRTTISELMRQNRELELKIHFGERQKKAYLGKIKTLYEESVRGSASSGAPGTSCIFLETQRS